MAIELPPRNSHRRASLTDKRATRSSNRASLSFLPPLHSSLLSTALRSPVWLHLCLTDLWVLRDAERHPLSNCSLRLAESLSPRFSGFPAASGSWDGGQSCMYMIPTEMRLVHRRRTHSWSSGLPAGRAGSAASSRAQQYLVARAGLSSLF